MKSNHKKLLLYIAANVVLVSLMIAHTIMLINQMRTDSLNNEQQKYENSVDVINHQVTFYMDSSKRTVREWGMMCSHFSWTFSETANNIGNVNSDSRVMVMVLSADDLIGFSSESDTDASVQDTDLNGIYSLSRELEAFRSTAKDGDVYITSTFTNVISGEQSIAFVTMINAKNDETGNEESAYLMRVEPLEILKESWFFNSNYPGIQISIINSFGDYILRSPIFKNDNFYEFLRSYNELTYPEIDELSQEVNSAEKGHFTFKNAQGEDTLFGYSTRGYNDWVVIGALPLSELDYAEIQWSLLISPLFTFIMLLVINILFFQSLNHKLRTSLEKLETANSAKTNFMSSMSHDIRTPMNAIIGLTTIAEQDIDDHARVKNCLNKISLASGHLLTLINDILDISQVESGKFTINPVQFSLADSAIDLVNIMYPQAEEKKLECTIHLVNITQEYLLADKLRLNQIWLNILSNAVKYTPTGGSIDIILEEQPIPDDPSSIMLYFTAKDTGIGMSPEFVKSIFEPFAREKDSRTDKIQGSGLGMAITKQIVDLLGGTISVHSEQGKGSEFRVSLKLKRGYCVKYDKLPDGFNVLLIGRSNFSVNTKRFVNELGGNAECTTTEEYAEFIRKRSASEFNMVLIDRVMADTGCIDIARDIHSYFGEECPPIVISAFDWTDIENEARSAGVSDFMTRPVFKTVLMDMFSKLLEGKIGRTDAGNEIASDDDLVGLNVLIAEDNDINWEIISDLVASFGIKADRAENGRICVDMLKNSTPGKYAMIFMDIQMPVMNGLEATQLIRKLDDEQLAAIPIVAMTANAFAKDVSDCISAGMNGHIAKPVNVNLLLSEIKKYVGKRRNS